jgi:N-acetylglucosamine-6-phosphate deacetylase
MIDQEFSANIPGGGFARVVVADGVIQAVERLGPQRDGKAWLAPGFLDSQLNGFAGVDFSDPELEPEQAIGVLPALWATGVVGFCPTLVTNSEAALIRSFRVLEAARGADPRFGAAVPCYHLEGPYIAPEARGIHAPQFLRAPDWEEFCRLQDAAGCHIGIVTLAPELPGALELIRRLDAAGVIAAIGHTVAGPAAIHAAVEAGARLSTHLGNGCPQILDRHENPLWAQFTNDALFAGVICDGFHLPADVLQVIVRTKGVERCILTTDATHVATLPPGRYSLVGTPIDLLPDGKVVRADGGCLGGSALTMPAAVAGFRALAGVTMHEALLCSAATAARLLRKPGLCANVEPGQPANLVSFRWDEAGVRVASTLVAGRKVFPASKPASA